MADKTIRVLIIEDRPEDFALIERELQRAGMNAELQVVDNERDFLRALESGPDIVLSDFSLPGFSGPRALALLKERALEIPFIIVSGTIGEDMAVSIMRQGATDYLLKDRLQRLGLAITQALSRRELREQNRLAEISLRESEERFRSLFENATIGLYRTTPDGQILMANPALVKMLGYQTFEQLAMRNLEREGSPAGYSRERFIETMEREGMVIGAEAPWIRVDGSTVYVRESARAIRGEDGTIRYYEGTVEDISERKQAEMVLYATNERLQTLVEAAPIAIVTTDLDGQVSSWNMAAEQIFGWTAEEVMGQALPFAPPQSPDETLRLRQRKVRGEKIARLDLRRYRKDGAPVDVSVSSAALLDAGGTVTGILCLIEDITERNRAEHALHYIASEARCLLWYADVEQDEHGEMVWHLILSDDDAAQRFLPLEVAPGQTYLDAWHASRLEEDQERTCEFGDEEVRAGRSYTQEFRCRRRDGRVRWLREDVRIEVVRPGFWRAVGVCTDITERKLGEARIVLLNAQLEQRVKERTEQLEATNRELESFAYSVSHDLRAPLRSINGFSQALLDDYSAHLDSRGQEYLHRVQSSSQRMGILIDSLLGLSTIARSPLRMDEVDLSGIAKALTAELQSAAPERDAEIRIEDGIVVKGDLSLLNIVMVNLLGNAWKFTRKRTPARITFGKTSRDGETVYFVRDNGAGFDMEYAGKLFGAFQRLHSAQDFEGTGIGLATVQRIIHRHGGRIWAEGTVGAGAVFYFTLC